MISNTSCSELNLVERVGFLPDEYQQIFQFSTPTPSNGNNNNNIPNNKNMNSTPFTFYTSGSVREAGDTTNNKCTNILVQQSSDGGIANKLNSPVIVQAKECIHYEPCSFYDSKPDQETKKMFKTVNNYSALNGVVDGGSGIAIVPYTNETEKTAGDTNINGRNSNKSNNSSRSSKSDRHKSPMCRTEDQENAFRQIEDVHNYSKLNRYGYSNGRISRTADVALYSSNSSNQEDEDDDDDDDVDDVDEEVGEGEEDDDEDIVSYEKRIHPKVEVLSAIGRPCDKISEHIKLANFADQILPQQKITTNTLDMEEAVEMKLEEDNIPPDHHARRPMNAFLIFCKRHRGIVKNKYKNFENRLITKILGEWWASLDANDKKCYVNLAKQNKDAFFSANPNFKWYKLPAPSLRTLHTRPGNIERPFPGSGECEYDLNDSPIQTAITYHPISPNAIYNRNDLKKVPYFKLADETQMGELNNLIRPTATLSASEVLHESLGETSDHFNTGCKQSSTSSVNDRLNTKRLHRENSFSSSEEDHMPKKSSRSCKGKKYQELINSGQISAVIPKKQVSPKPSRPTVSSTNRQSPTHIGQCNVVTSAMKNEQIMQTKDAQTKLDEGRNMPEAYESKVHEGQYMLSGSYESPSKQHFSFVSFDLEDKIKSLPAQCLETYLHRKKNTKRKKKINSKKRTPPQPKMETVKSDAQRSQLNHPKTAQEAKEQMVGSQKRKARKESITRRDINSIQNDVQLLMTSPVNSVVTGGAFSVVPQTFIAVNHNATSDLLILAEVAANHTEIAP